MPKQSKEILKLRIGAIISKRSISLNDMPILSYTVEHTRKHLSGQILKFESIGQVKIIQIILDVRVQNIAADSFVITY